MRAAERSAHRTAQLLRDIVARHPATSAFGHDGRLVVEIPFRADDHHAAAREPATSGAAARSERRSVQDHELGAPARCCASDIVAIERLGTPTRVIPFQQLDGEPTHHRMRQRHQYARLAIAHRTAVA